MLLFISHAPQKHLFWKYVRMHLKSHTSQLYSRWRTICEQNSMSGITLFIKQLAKSLWMTHYFRRDSEICIWWTLFYPMSPQKRICEWQESNTSDAGRLHDNDNMTNGKCPYYFHTIHS